MVNQLLLPFPATIPGMTSGQPEEFPAILTNRCFFYLARNAVRVQEQVLDAGEDIEIFEVPLNEIPARIRNGEIDHGMVLLTFFFFWMKQGQIA